METEIKQVFEIKVHEKKQKLKNFETDLHRRYEQMRLFGAAKVTAREKETGVRSAKKIA